MKIKKLFIYPLLICSVIYAYANSNVKLENKSSNEDSILACMDKNLNDKCSIFENGKDKNGVCQSIINKEFLICSFDHKKIIPKTNDMVFTPIIRTKTYED